MEEKSLRVFISSRMSGMEAERRAARAAVQAIPLSRPVLIEFSSATSVPLAESYLSTVRASDVFLLLLKTTATEPIKAEVDAAQKAGRSLLVVIGKRIPEETRAYVGSLGVKYTSFGDTDQLATLVAEAFGDELISGYRKYGVPVSDLSTIGSFLERLNAGQVKIVPRYEQSVSGPVSTGGGAYVGSNVSIIGDQNVVIRRSGAEVVAGDKVTRDATHISVGSLQSDLRRYLQDVINRSRYVSLQGIRAVEGAAQVELTDVYIKPRMIQEQDDISELQELLAKNRYLVVIGDPGAGKTMLLHYLALLYAKDLAESTHLVRSELGLQEQSRLPVLIPLEQLYGVLNAGISKADTQKDPPSLLSFVSRAVAETGVDVSSAQFSSWLATGRIILLLDGLDAISDSSGRSMIWRFVDEFANTYPLSRCVMTSRSAVHTDEAQLAGSYEMAKIASFSQDEIENFLTQWYLLIYVSQMGPGDRSRSEAVLQTKSLLQVLAANERVRDLATNPMMLTMIAPAFQSSGRLPGKVSDLYAQMVDLLLSYWDSRRRAESHTKYDQLLVSAERLKITLADLALHMHDRRLREIARQDVLAWLARAFERLESGGTEPSSQEASRSLLRWLEERSGLLVRRSSDRYQFSQFAFQEYLSATAMAAGDDYLKRTLSHLSDPWWREVILLEVGHLSGLDPRRAMSVIQGIADSDDDTEPYGNLLFAAQCLRQADDNRALGSVYQRLRERMRAELDTPSPSVTRWRQDAGKHGWVKCRSQLAQAYVDIGGGYWSLPYGEPEWIDIPAGAFWQGEDQKERRVLLDGYAVARTPITNAQYHIFIRDSGRAAPSHWQDGHPPRDTDSHPVVGVSWHDAVAYCEWLSRMTGKGISLPTEVEWEKAARGATTRYAYPWGDRFISENCNTRELGVKRTTPVGIFPKGVSPYGCLDMSGNVLEWTASLAAAEDLVGFRSVQDAILRVARGGSWRADRLAARCTARSLCAPDQRNPDLGFRVVLSLPQRTLLDDATAFFRQAGFAVAAADRGLGEFSVSTDKWATHTDYGSILVQAFRGDLSGDHLRHLEHRLSSLPVARTLAYAVYEGELSVDAFWQMGAYKIGNGLTIIPLKAELLHEALVAVQPNCYARLRVVEQEYLGQGANRYEESNAITDPTWFFGRRAEVEEILDRLKSGQHAGIFGMRKIGKTSLLLHLRQSVTRLSIPVAYLGLQSKPIDPPVLFRDVVQQLRSLLESMGVNALPECGLLGNQPGASVDKLFMEDVRALWETARAELKVPFMLLLIDEADRIVPKPGNADSIYQKYDQFFAPIRDLSQVDRCLLTVVTAERPTIREEFKQSPLPNTMFELYDERYLASFSVAELENMIVRIGKWMGLEYSTESLRVIAEESACHPYVARALCACVARDVKGAQVSAQDVMQAREDALGRLHEYFLGWWANLYDQERQILHTVLTTQALPADMTESQQDALRYLQKQQAITQTPAGWMITIGLLREWLKRRIGGGK